MPLHYWQGYLKECREKKNETCLNGYGLLLKRIESNSPYTSYEEACHQLIKDIIAQQINKDNRVINDNSIKKLFVDGGISKNQIYI